MVEFYVQMIKRGLKDIKDVPARYRKEVEAALVEDDKEEE